MQEARILVRELHLLADAKLPEASGPDDREVDEAAARYLRRDNHAIPRRHQTTSDAGHPCAPAGDPGKDAMVVVKVIDWLGADFYLCQSCTDLDMRVAGRSG